MDGRDYTLLAAGAAVGIIGLKLTTTGMMRAEGEEIASCVRCEKDKAAVKLEATIDTVDTSVRKRMSNRGRQLTSAGKKTWDVARQAIRDEPDVAEYKQKLAKWFLNESDYAAKTELWEDVVTPKDTEVPAGQEQVPDWTGGDFADADLADAQVPPEVEMEPEPELTKEKMVKAGLWQQFVDFFRRK